MVTVVNDPNRRSTGSLFGEALSHALQGLASHKIGQMQQRKNAQAYQNYFNLNPQQANALASLSPDQQNAAIKELITGGDVEEFKKQARGQINPQEEAAQPMQMQQAQQQAPQLGVSPQQEQEFYKYLRSPQAHQGLSTEVLQALGQQPATKGLNLESRLNPEAFQPQLQQQEQAPQAAAESAFNPASITDEQKAQLAELLNNPEMIRDIEPEHLDKIRGFVTPKNKAVQGPGSGRLNQKQTEKLLDYEMQREKLGSTEQARIDKDAKKTIQDIEYNAKLAGQILPVTEEALDIVNKHQDKFPKDVFLRNLPTRLRSDPDVRTYERLVNSIVAKLVQTNAGRMTNARQKLIQEAKASIDQPISTQINALNEIVREWSGESDRARIADEIIKENKGEYPKQFGLKITLKEQELDQARKNPLKYPDVFEEGTQVEDNGKMYVLKAGKWVGA